MSVEVLFSLGLLLLVGEHQKAKPKLSMSNQVDAAQERVAAPRSKKEAMRSMVLMAEPQRLVLPDTLEAAAVAWVLSVVTLLRLLAVTVVLVLLLVCEQVPR